MKITCAICGFTFIDQFRTIFDTPGHKRPDVYICETCITWGSKPQMRRKSK